MKNTTIDNITNRNIARLLTRIDYLSNKEKTIIKAGIWALINDIKTALDK